MPPALFEAVDCGDVGMIQRGEHLGFALEPCQAVGVVRERLRQDLDRDVTIQLGVACAVDLTHSTLADRGDDFVDAEARAGAEWQVYASIRGGPGAQKLVPRVSNPSS